MYFILDLILVAICFFTIFFATKRGFVRSVMGFVSKIVALVVAYTFTPALAALIRSRIVIGPLSDSISSYLKSRLAAGDGYDFSRLSENASSILERYLVSGEDITEKVKAMEQTGEEALRYVSEQIAGKVAVMISTAVAFLILFFVTCFILWLVTVAVDSIFSLPVLRTANTALGAVFGVCSAVLIAIVYCAGVTLLVGALGSVEPNHFGDDVIDKTLIVKFIANTDLIDLTQNLIS